MCDEGMRERVSVALAELRTRDSFLFQNNLHERTICHKFAEYLQGQFPDYCVDCEYNREGENPKEVHWRDDPPDGRQDADGHGDSIFPDIIVHERGMNDRNLLVVEVKKANNRLGREDDIAKIRACITELRYACGLLIVFNTQLPVGTDDDIVADLRWFP